MEIVEAVLLRLGPFVLVSGGAKGVDKFAQRFAEKNNWPTPIIHRPNWDAYGKAAGPIRNTEIIRDAEAALVFWDGKSKGTLDSLTKARVKEMPIVLCEMRNGIPYVTVENTNDNIMPMKVLKDARY